MKNANQSGDPVMPRRRPARRAAPARFERRLLSLTIALLVAAPFAAAGGAHAAAIGSATTPTGGVVVGGAGTITQDGARTLIQQQSAKLALDWQSFNVGQDASVLFKQPSTSAVALNRILDQSPSQIFGRIDSNGQVFLINTHGFIFGASAKLNVGGLLASTLDLTPKDFLANHYNLDAHGESAGIVNHGLIQAASGGSVALVGGSVKNDGVILANYGSIHLDGADRAVLDFDGNGLIQIQVTGALQKRLDEGAAAVDNNGTLKADSGTVVLQASAAKDLFTNLVNNEGVVDAGGISTAGGVVRLVASGGNTQSSGSINVSGTHGGSAQLLSDQDVMVTGTASVDASGTAGGGTIRVGGGVHGGEGLTQAERSYVAPDASLRADATQSGDGGSIAVWSTGNTVSAGTISARGGALGGNGGFVETSGQRNLSVTRAPDVGAANGLGGTWLVDPNDLTIDAGSGNTNINAASPFATTGDAASLGVDLITDALKTGDVTIATATQVGSTGSGNITVNSGFSFDGTGAPPTGKLTLTADNDISFASGVRFTGTSPYKLSVDLEAGNGISFASGSGIDTNGGDVTLHATGSAGGGITFDAGSSITAGAGNFVLNADAAGIQLGAITAGSLTATAAGTITQAGAATIAGTSSFTAGTHAITLDDSGNKFTGDVSLTGSDLALTNGMATSLGAVTASGTLGVTSTGAITQTGALNVTGASDFSAGSDAITLNGPGNTLTGAVSLSGSDVALTNDMATSLGNVAATGTLGVASNGDLTQSGTLSAGGAATFTQNGAAGNILLGSTTLGGDVTFAGSSIGSLSLANSAPITNLTIPAITGDLSLGYASGTLAWPVAGIGSIGGSLSLSAPAITLNGSVSTVGTQSYSGPVTLGADATLQGTSVNLADGVTGGGFGLTITGPATLGAMTGLSALSVSGASLLNGNVTTTGTQTYTGAVTLGAATTLKTTDSAIGFGSTLDSNGLGPWDLTLSSGTGVLTFGGVVGGSGPLGAIDASASGAATFAAAVTAGSLKTGTGTTSLAGDVTTTGAQTYGGAVTLGATPMSLTSGSGGISVAGTLDNASSATPVALTVDAGSGSVGFTGAVGSVNGGLAGLTTTSGGFSAGALNVGGNLAVTTTAGAITQGGAFTVTGTSSFDAAANAITLSNPGNNFGAAVSLINSGANPVTLNNGSHPLTLGTSNIGSGTLGLTSGGLTLGGMLTTAGGAVSLSGPVALGADGGIDTTGGGASGAAISLAGAVDGGYALTLDAGTGTVTLGADLGGTTPLASLALAAGGGITLNNASVKTTGNQTYAGAVTLGNDLTLASSGSGAIDLAGTVNGAHALTVNTGGSTIFGDAVGGSTALSGVTTDAGGSTSLHGNVTTSGAQIYGDDLTLTGDATLKGTSVSLQGVTGGSHDLATDGATTLGGAIASVGALSITGTTAINAASIATSGNQTYTGAVTLGQDGTLASSGGGDIGFTGTVDGAQALTVNTSGVTSFGGAVGGATALTGLTTDAGGSSSVNGNVTTTGAQSWGDALNLGGDTTLKGSGISLQAVTGATHDLTTVGATTLGGVLSGVGALSVTGTTTIVAPSVATAGDQTYGGAVLLGTDTILTSGGTTGVTFNGAIDNATPTARTLEVTANAGQVTFGGAVGNGANGALAGLGVTSAGDIGQSAGGLFKVSGASSFNAGSGNITLGEANGFGGAVSLAGNNVTIDNAGPLVLGASTVGGTLAVTAGGSITQAAAPAPLAVTGASSFTVTAAGSDVLLKDPANDLQGAVTVAASGAGTVHDLWLTNTASSAGNFTPPASLTGDLTLDYANAALTLPVTTLSGALDVTSGVGITLMGGVTTGGSQAYHGALTLGAGVTLDSSTGNGSVTLDGTVGNATGTTNDLTVKAGSGTVSFGDAVGTGASPLGAVGITTSGATAFAKAVDAASLTASGPVSLGGDVTTAGAQSYGGAVTLGTSSMTLTSAAGGISFASTLDNASIGTPVSLTVSAGTGDAQFTGAVGSLNGALTGLTASGHRLTTGSTLAIGNGGLSVTTTGGDITQAALGGYTVTGTSAFDAGAHAISLNASNNAFGAAVSLANSGANDVTLDNGSNALLLDASTLGSGTLTLKGAGITQVAGTAITQAAGAGAVTLDATLADDLVLAEAGNDFSGPVTATGKAVELASNGALTIASLTNAADSNVSLSAGGQLTLAPTINDIDTGAADLTLVSGGTLALPGALSGHDITLTSDSDLAINNVLTGTGTIMLTSTAGNITQSAAIVSTGGALAGRSGGSTTLLDPGNKVANLGEFKTGGDFAFNNAQALTVDKPVLANGGLGNITLTTTGAGSNLVLDTQIQGTGVQLTSGGVLSQTANGTIQSVTLTGSSVGDTTLTGPNEVGTLNAFNSGGDFSFTNAAALMVLGPLASSSGNITLKTTGATSDLALDTGISATNVELDSGRAITQQAGTVITATTLKGSAAGDVTLDGANLVTTLGDFSAANFSLVNAQALDVAGTLNVGGTGSISLQTTSGALGINSDLTGGAVALDSAADLGLAQDISGATSVALKSGGAINQTAGIITAGTLGGSSVGATTLGQANQIAALGDFSAAGFSLVNAQSLAINGALDGGPTVDLTLTAGDLTEGGLGVITAATLTGSSAGDTTLEGANLVDTLGNFSAANFSLTNDKDLAVNGTLSTTGGTGNISLKTTSGTLGVNSNLSGGAISLVSATDLALGQTIDGSVSVNLGAGGAITQNAAGTIQTATLTGTSGGDTTLDGANLVGTLGNFTTGGNFAFNSAQSLTVSNPVSANGGLGNITLTTSGVGSDLELATQVKGTTVTLGATGAITQTPAGTIQAATLTGNSGGDTTLTGPNQVATLGAFTTGGNFSFANATTLTVTGPLSAPGGDISLSSAAGGGGNLLLNTSINATNVTLAAGGAITQQAGTAIQADTLTGSATGQVALDGANLIDTLGSFSAAGFSLTNAQGLTVAGPLTTSGDVSLTTTSGVLNVNTDLSGAAISLDSAGDLTLAHAVNGSSINLESGGNISQAAGGSLTAATLTGKSAGSTVLGGAGGGIGALGDFTANGFTLTNGQALAVTGVVDGGPSVKLVITAGDLTINGTVKGTATTLTSAGAIGEGDAGMLSAATLTGSSAGATTLASTHNTVATLDGFTAKGFSLTSSQALTVNSVLDGGDGVALTTTAGDLTLAGAVNGVTTSLDAAGTLREGPGASLTATTLSGSAGGDAILDGTNQIATLGQFSAQNLELTDSQALDVVGPVTIADAGKLHLTTTAGAMTIDGALAGGDVALDAAGDLTLNQTVKGTTVALVSGGKISQSASGILTAGTLTGSSVGATALDPVNHVDTLGSFSADGFSLASDHALTVTGPVAGGPTLLLKTTGGDLAINGAVSGKDATLVSSGAITEGSGGSLVAETLTGSSVGATTLDASGNRVGTLNAFSANGFTLTAGQALTIAQALDAGSSLTLTTQGDLLINAGVTSTGLTTLDSAGAITEGAGGLMTAGTLTGSASGPTWLGDKATPVLNLIGTLGGFVSPAGFSLTNNQTLTLASVNGSQYTVDAGTSATYLSVLTGDFLQDGSNWLRNGTGTWSSDGALGSARNPIYVLGVGAQQLDAVGFPPGYFYAIDAQGNLLPLTGAASFNVPTSALTSHAQNSNNHTDAYIDPSIITARYRAFGMVPPGILLPPDQQACSPDADDCSNE